MYGCGSILAMVFIIQNYGFKITMLLLFFQKIHNHDSSVILKARSSLGSTPCFGSQFSKIVCIRKI